jgi:hypothetical protein
MSLPEQNTPWTQSRKSSPSPGLIPSSEIPQSHQSPQELPPEISNQATFILKLTEVFNDLYKINREEKDRAWG